MRNICARNSFSIVNNNPKPIVLKNEFISIITVDKPIKYTLIIRSPITMLCLECIDKDIKSVKKIIGYGKGLQKELNNLSLKYLKGRNKR